MSGAALELIPKPNYDAALLKSIGAAADNVLAAAAQRPCEATNALLAQVNESAWLWCETESMATDEIQLLGRMDGILDNPEGQKLHADLMTKYGTDADPDLLEEYIREFNRLSKKHKRESSLFEKSPEDFAALRCTDLANAVRFEEAFGHSAKHSSSHGWLVWDGTRWKRDSKGADLLAQKIGELIRGEIKDVSAKLEPGDREAFERLTAYIDALRKRLKPTESRRGIDDALKLSMCRPGINADAIEFDSDPWALNVLNGTVDLRTGELRSHRREDFNTKLAPVEYDGSAKCPRWLRFLDEIFDGDAELVAWMQWLCGYTATGSTHRHIFPILHGSGRNGKSVLLNILRHVLGTDYTVVVNPEDLMVRKTGGDNHTLPRLYGARFAMAQETAENRKIDEALIKSLTGGDPVVARILYKENFEFLPSHTLWMSTNYRPRITGTAVGIWERVRLIPFNREFTGDEQDPHLEEKLQAEIPGILNWILEGARMEEPPIPKCVKVATDEYRSESDTLAAWLDDALLEWKHATVLKRDVYAAYRSYMNAHCEDQTAFNKRLVARGFEDKRTEKGYVWTGISLRENRINEPQ